MATYSISALDLSDQSTNRLKNNLSTYYLMDRRDEGLFSFYNLGNTCFLNVVLQCLGHTRPLTDFIFEARKSDSEPTPNRLFLEFSNLVKEMWARDGVIKPASFFQTFCLTFKKNNHNQEDAHEVLLFLLDNFHEALKYPVVYQDVNKHALIPRSLQALEKTQMSIINSLFMGQFHQRVQCLNCKHIEHSFPTFLNLMLPIPYLKNQKEDVNIYDLLSEFCYKEPVTRNCDHCQVKNGDAFKKTTFWRLPQILIFQLKRFNPSGGKNNHKVDYPLTWLDLTQYTTYPHNKKQFYNLYGVICHIGVLQAGHYFSLIQKQNRWILFNDHQGRHLTEDNVVSPHAYLLFYQRQ